MRKKVEKHQKLKAESDELYEELREFFEEEHGVEGFYDSFIADEPKGIEQTEDGEFCDQTTLGEDWYRGEYYYPIENSENISDAAMRFR